jgi:GNAT superfamily N-acetyltransferase
MIDSVVIRPAVPSEQKALEALQWRASLENPGDRDALLAHPDAIELPIDQIVAGHVFVAEQDGGLVGFAVVLPREDGAAELDGLFVDPSSWRRGIGRQLVDRCAEVALARGSSTLHVIGNNHAEGFYSSCGFERLGAVPTRFGDGLSMQKRL